MSGSAFRPLCGADHVKPLLHASSCPSTCSSSSSSGGLSRKGVVSPSWLPWSHHRQGIPAAPKKMDSFGFLGQQDVIGSLAELCKCLSRVPEQPVLPTLALRSHVREGGADSESKGSFESRKSVLKKEPSLLLSLVQEIQPLDVTQISKEVSPDSTDAMKRTTSGMLGLLPSDQFHVTVETSREPLAKLFVSSMMTGYTLRNAEYRLCLQKSLEFSGDDEVGVEESSAEHEVCLDNFNGFREGGYGEEERDLTTAGKALEDFLRDQPVSEDAMDTSQSLGSISDEAKQYIDYLKQKVASVTKELEECKRINTGLQVQTMVGEEKNDLLDYLRSLSPDKVAELSQPTSPEVEGVIQQVINGLLDNPIMKLQHKGSQLENGTASTFNSSWEEGTKKFSMAPLQSHSAVTVSRDHLARLLFWCMLLGHHMRGLEYRLELSRTLSLSGDLGSSVNQRKQDG